MSLRVAFLNRGRETHPGGDVIALDATMEALRRKGVYCEETGWDVKKLTHGNFDLAHICHSNFDWSYGNYCAVENARGRLQQGLDDLPYVLQPIFYPGLRAGITTEQLSEIVMSAKIVLPFSNREGEEMRSELGWFPYEAIPNGTDPSFHCHTPASEREGVLCVSARGSEDKGIPLVRAACERLGIPFTCVTGVPHDQLPAIYAKHRVFVNASDSERMSLTVGEALCAGCRVICHRGNRGNEWYPGIATFVDPPGIMSLEDWLDIAYDPTQSFFDTPESARELTWDYVAERLLEVYAWASR